MFIEMMIELDHQHKKDNIYSKKDLISYFNKNMINIKQNKKNLVINKIFEYWKYKRFKLLSPFARS